MRPRRRPRARRGARGSSRRSHGILWLLLGLLSAGLLAVFYFRRLEEDEEGVRPRARPASPRPPAQPPPAPSDRTYWVAGPACNLYVRDAPEPLGAAGPPVLFVHGLAGNGGHWSAQLDHLRRRGRRALALDLRGHGASEPAEDGDYSIEALAADLAAVADQTGLRRFVLAAHSLGALVAIEYAGRHPDRVVALLLVDPNGDSTLLPSGAMDSFLASVRADPHGELASYYRQILINAEPAAARWVLEDVGETAPEAIAAALEATLRYSPLTALDAYPGPKLAVISDINDHPISLHKLRPALPVRWIPHTGHWLMMDKPQELNQVMDELLAAAG